MAQYSYNDTSAVHEPSNPVYLTLARFYNLSPGPRYDAIPSTHNHWLEGSSPFSPASLSSQLSPTGHAGDLGLFQEGMHCADPSTPFWNPQETWNPDIYGPRYHHDDYTYDASCYSTEDLYQPHVNGYFASHSDLLLSPSEVATMALPVSMPPELLQLPVTYSNVNAPLSVNPTDLYEAGSDLDAEGETNKEDDGDEEYISPTLTQRSSHRNTSNVTSSSSTHSPHSRYTSPESPPECRPARTASSSHKSHPGDQKSSCHTFRDTTPTRFTRRQEPGTGPPNYTSTNDAGDFCCETCHRVFPRARRPDFERHVDTHYPELAKGGPTLCCGVPVEQVKDYTESDVMIFYEQRMVGGCGKIFSRTDSLRRHLDSSRNSCIGNLHGEWHPPKQVN